MPIAVIVSRFPKLTETFIVRELDELDRAGIPVLLVPLIRHAEQRLHPRSSAWMRRALWTPWLDAATLRSCAYWLRSEPGRVVRILARVLAAEASSPVRLVKTLGLVPKGLHLARLLEGKGVIHVHAHFATYPTAMARLVAALSGATYSVTAHAHDIFVDARGLRARLRDASFVRCISRYNADYVARIFESGDGPELRVGYLGVDTRQFVARDGRRAGDTPCLVCVAGLRPYKGVDVLLKACALLRERGVDFKVRIVGDGPMRARLEREAERKGLTPRLQWEGDRTEGEVAAILRDADIFAHPSVVAPDGQMDGVPVAIMEAMSAGIPVVSSRLSGIPELVVHEETGLLVDADNPPALADAIERLLADPAARASMGRRGRARIETRFDLRANSLVLGSWLAEESAAPERALARRIPAFVDARSVAVVEVRSGPDSHVEVVSCQTNEGKQDLVLKEHLPREGESAAPAARAAQEAAELRRAADHLRAYSGLGVPTVLARDGGLLVLTRSTGRRLDELSLDSHCSPNVLASGARTAGRWLRAYHRPESERPAAGRSTTELLEVPTADLAAATGLLGRSLTRAATTAVKQLAERLMARDGDPLARPTTVHGDYWPGNILLDRDRVEVIDFEGSQTGLAAYDIEYFLVHLERVGRRRGRAELELVSQSLRSGYGSWSTGGWRSWGRFAVAARLAAVAAGRHHSFRQARWIRRIVRNTLRGEIP